MQQSHASPGIHWPSASSNWRIDPATHPAERPHETTGTIMSALTRLAQRFQKIENIAPQRWRLPLRYHGQRLVGGLEDEMGLLPQLVPENSVALDIGANHGIYAYALSRLSPAVHCFEPLAECCRYIRSHHAANITVHNVALSDRDGELELHVPVIGGRAVYTRASLDRPDGPFESRHVEVRPLDSYDLTGVGFIKIDVEGLEGSVLRGADCLLKTCHPNLLVEIDRARHTQDSFLAVHATLQALGYQAYVCEAGNLMPCRDAWNEGTHRVNFIFKQATR
jgi:FkbM family methyltransferase